METNEYELPALNKHTGWDELDSALAKFATDYARQAIAPLLQDLAAHEASNRIKTENLETLRQQLADAQADAASWQQQVSARLQDWDQLREENWKLKEALWAYVDWTKRSSENMTLGAEEIGLYDAARAALGESNG